MTRGPLGLSVLRRIEDGGELSIFTAGLDDTDLATPEVTSSEVDGSTTIYVLTAQTAFDGLRRTAMQLAGLMLLAALGGLSRQDHPLLGLAETAHATAADVLRSLSVPDNSAHHHHHLLKAERALLAALHRIRSGLHHGEDAQTKITHVIELALEHLRSASKALPGFDLVSFSDGCCACVVQSSRQIPTRLQCSQPTPGDQGARE